MRLWTIQDEGFWLLCKEKGVLRTDGRKIAYRDDFKVQYRWMKDQMRNRIPGYKGRSPIWFYTDKPDMRMRHWGLGGQRVYRIEVEVPDEKVLVSDYQLWHIPLNNGYLGVNEEDDDAFDKEEEERVGKFSRSNIHYHWWDPESGYPVDLRDRIFDSWERIFPDRWDELEDDGNEYYGSYRDQKYSLQAVVEEVPMDWVVKAEPYVIQKNEFALEDERDPDVIIKETYDERGNIIARSYKRKKGRR